MKRKNAKKLIPIVAMAVAATFSVAALPACGEEQPEPSRNAAAFINYVTAIRDNVTLDTEGKIEASYILYDFLSDEDKAFDVVSEAKTKLDGYKATLDVLLADKAELDAIELQNSYMSRFIASVGNLPKSDELRLTDKTALEAAGAIYENLNETSRSDDAVQAARARLTLLNNKMEELEEEARLAEIREMADDFCEGVEELTEEDITMDSRQAIEALVTSYDNLPDEAKAYPEVVSAKAKLDRAKLEYQAIKDKSDVAEYLSLAEKLGNVNAITLKDKNDIIYAESIYDDMSDDARTKPEVEAARRKIVAARERYEELFAVEENARVQDFIAKAGAVGTNLDEVDMSWFRALDNAGKAYDALTIESQALPEVEAAFIRWNNAQRVFDSKGYERVPMKSPVVQIAGDGNVVLAQYTNMTNALNTFYGVDNYTKLDQYVDLCLDFYEGDVLVGTGKVKFADLFNNGSLLIMNANVVSVLKQLGVTSGKALSLSLHIEDKKGEFIYSESSKMSDRAHVYRW